MSNDTLLGIVTAIAAIALVTTLVLPGRQTGSILTDFFGGLAKAINSALGRG